MAYTTIDNPFKYFNTVLYSGTGSSQAITGVGFQPDWIWFKCRSQNQNHNLFDVIRGSNKIIQTSTSNAEATSTDLLTSFDSDGFTVNTDGGVNGSGQTYASWNWLASNTTASNSDGSITSTVSANTTAGFSIVSFDQTSSPQTIGHGLNSVPKIIFIKDRDSSSSNWQVYSESIGASNKLLLDSTNASASSGVFNSTAPTSSVFTFNSDFGSTIAYCFAEKKGYSKFGSYVGNSSTDGTFVYTGFKPALVIFKSTAGTESWSMVDNKRDTSNVVKKQLFPNLNNVAETTNNVMDFCSNGFKMRNSDTRYNYSSYTYIYMAFAEAPFVTAGTKAAGTAR